MKIRCGFVSNSSDASFAIPLDRITKWQVEAICRHSALGGMLGIEYADDAWSIMVTEKYVLGDTSMDNFDMDEFFDCIGIPKEVVCRDSGSGNWTDVDPPDWEDEDARETMAVGRWVRRKNTKPDTGRLGYGRMPDEEFFREFLKHKDFEFLEKLAEKSDMVKKILADPSFEVGKD